MTESITVYSSVNPRGPGRPYQNTGKNGITTGRLRDPPALETRGTSGVTTQGSADGREVGPERDESEDVSK